MGANVESSASCFWSAFPVFTVTCPMLGYWTDAGREFLFLRRGWRPNSLWLLLPRWFWAITADGAVRDVCVTVMVVCSVTTVLFNGNPLLRYDGYYILSDLVGIPNLASQSASFIRDWLRRCLWATPAPDPSDWASRQGVFRCGLWVGQRYLYRTAIYLLILWMLYRVAEELRTRRPSGNAGFDCDRLVLLQVGSIRSWPRPTARFVDPGCRRDDRRLVVSGVVDGRCADRPGSTSRSVVAPMSIQPAGAQPIFVSSEGAISESMVEGADVIAGQVIAKVTQRRSRSRTHRDGFAVRPTGLRT